MLYTTHKRYGQVAAMVALPLSITVGVVEVDQVKAFGDVFLGFEMVSWFAVVMVAYLATIFGAGFPDIDAPGSTPARKHKILAMLMQMCGVKHRGKFSHDFLTQTLFWGFIYMVVGYVGSGLVTGMFTEFVLYLVQLGIIFTLVGVFSHLIGDAMTADGVWFAGFKVRFMPVFVRHIGVGPFKPFKSWFTTSSSWDLINRRMMTLVLPLAAVYMITSLTAVMF